MGLIFQRTLKCENCGFEHQGKFGGHVISNGERYSVAQYCCNACHTVIDLEYRSSLKDNKETYFYPDGTSVSYDIKKSGEELKQENAINAIYKAMGKQKDTPPFCQKCGSHLSKLDVDAGKDAYCPECGQKSLIQKEIHVIACVD